MTRTPTRIAVVGAAGRMGREVVRAALEDDSIELGGGVVETGAPELGADIGELCGWEGPASPRRKTRRTTWKS